jgi:hypothetical protein
MRSLACIGLSALSVTAAAAGDGSPAMLRGSRAYEAGASYQIQSSAPVFAPPPGYAIAPSPYAAAPSPYAPAQAVAATPVMAAAVPSYSFEVGARYWYSTGKLSKGLFDDPRFTDWMVSRLTYDNVTANSFEAFGRISFANGMFVKGLVGLGGMRSGSLNDEDFAPYTYPYSSTMSDQRGGQLDYAIADVGYAFAVHPRATVAPFVGFGFLAEKVNAYGCTQIATNPGICVPSIAANVLGITEDAKWYAARVGVQAEVKVWDRLTLSGEAAWLPYAMIRSQDSHWLRIGTTAGSFSGAVPEEGSGMGVQLEAMLSYQVWDCFSIGVGGRYWRIESKGTGDLEQTVIGATNPVSQPVNFITERYGAFLQGSYRFNLM